MTVIINCDSADVNLYTAILPGEKLLYFSGKRIIDPDKTNSPNTAPHRC